MARDCCWHTGDYGVVQGHCHDLVRFCQDIMTNVRCARPPGRGMSTKHNEIARNPQLVRVRLCAQTGFDARLRRYIFGTFVDHAMSLRTVDRWSRLMVPDGPVGYTVCSVMAGLLARKLARRDRSPRLSTDGDGVGRC